MGAQPPDRDPSISFMPRFEQGIVQGQSAARIRPYPYRCGRALARRRCGRQTLFQAGFMIGAADVSAIADAIDRALDLESVIRYLDMFHWAEESRAFHAARAAEGPRRLESVAEHTWHMTYMAGLLLPYYAELDARRVYELIQLHDILELITGDYDPTGSDGLGTNAYSMDAVKMADKTAVERAALEQYLLPLPAPVARWHRLVLEEELAGESAEARFVKVVDKMQSLVYIRARKQ